MKEVYLVMVKFSGNSHFSPFVAFESFCEASSYVESRNSHSCEVWRIQSIAFRGVK